MTYAKYAVPSVWKGFILVALPLDMFLTETRILHRVSLYFKKDADDSHSQISSLNLKGFFLVLFAEERKKGGLSEV